MRETQNIEALAALKPDYIGFIFYPKSKRYAQGILDTKVLDTLPKTIQKVGVFVNSSVDQVIEVMNQYQLDVVQLHGNETPQECSLLKM